MASRAPASIADKAESLAAENLEDRQLDLVLVDATVLLKIAKHCRDNAPESVTGQLLGIDGKTDVEVSNCFPFPNTDSQGFDEEDDADAGTDYQIEMMRCLREVNIDAYTVGWYQTADLSSFSNETLLETQYNYQTNPLLSRKCVVLVYDPIMTLQTGHLHIRALRLSYAFSELYGKDPELLNSNFDRSQIFEEIPIKIISNPLSEAFLVGIKDEVPPSYEHLDLASNAFLEKNLEYVAGYLDEIQNENGRIQHYQRQQQRQQSQINAYLHKVRTENQVRREREQPEVEEDLTQFKKIAQPSRLPALVWMNQVDVYVDQVDKFARETSLKLFLLSEVKKQKSATTAK